ncbi:hypothetical protein EVU96_09430 [Bacillus infantis]|uniref:hypothetical protein n=1 Tax=Bacillus infantis TaxID=324767 RepID=UPI00101C6750|nr:hypothetical protein [Bacillus infantis]RYI30627.1 hypothetical protein EVU96_09430 [Bacillus infantis]
MFFNNPIITKPRKGTLEDPFVDLRESHQVVNGTVILSEIPDELNRVQVTGLSKQWYEVHNSESIAENEFFVDYSSNIVTFHPSINGESLDFNFKGTGMHYVPASMIYTQQNNNTVTETLDEIISKGDTALKAIEDLTGIVEEAETAVTNANSAVDDIEAKINQFDSNENTRISNEDTRKLNESDRQSAEISRSEEESVRIQSETTRQADEDQRILNEQQRQDNESIRQQQESDRQQNTQTAITNAQQATADANSVVDTLTEQVTQAQSIVDNVKGVGEFDIEATYQPNNFVRYNGSTYLCLQESIGNPPTDEIYFQLAAIRGQDGLGSVSSINNMSPDAEGNVQISKVEIGLDNVDNVKQATKTEFNSHVENTVAHMTQAEKDKLNNASTKAHSHSNKTVLDKITQTGTEATFDLSNMATKDQLVELGYGDMLKSTYDTNNSGKVDIAENAEMLGGKTPDKFANSQAFSDHALDTVAHMSTEEKEKLNNAIPSSEKGIANGVATLNAEGRVVDADGNEVEGKVLSVNGQVGEVTVFDGNYNNLINKPSIPSKTSEITNDSNFETISGSQTKVNTHAVGKASTITLGHVMVDGSTIQIDSTGKISVKAKEASPWIDASIGAGWNTTSTGMRYFKDEMGMVHVHGELFSGTDSSTLSPFMTLPVGYRPGRLLRFAVGHSASTPCALVLQSSGQMIMVGTVDKNTVSYGINIHFRAEQ